MKYRCEADEILLGDGTRLRVLYEDRSVMAIDKPFGWMFVPLGWSRTDKNLQLALESSLRENPHWVRQRNLKYLRYVHRLDADTTGLVLLAKSQGALQTFSDLFEQRQVEKRYLAVVEGRPNQTEWRCELALGSTTGPRTRVLVDPEAGRSAITDFKVLENSKVRSLVEARPLTGRTHQIRVHLAEVGFPIVGDVLYGVDLPAGPGRASDSRSADHRRPGSPGILPTRKDGRKNVLPELGLRSVGLSYRDPFTKRHVNIEAPAIDFLARFGFGGKPQARISDTTSP